MAWAWDHTGGVYKNHALSSKIREASVADSEFMRFFSPEPGYGKKRGDTVTLTRFHNLPLAGKVSETDRLPSGRPEISKVSIEVSEWGYKVPVTEFEENLTHFDLRSRIQRKLRDQMRLTCDKMCADALKTTKIKYRPLTVSTSAITTNGAFADVHAANIGFYHLREIYDYLSGTLKAPKWRNGRYIGILNTKAARGIKSELSYLGNLVAAEQPRYIGGNELLSNAGKIDHVFSAVLPNVEGFDLYETNHYDSLGVASGDANNGGAVFFGEDAGFLATVQDPELRTGPKEDLGRFQDVGWVGTIEAGLVWDDATNARVVHVGGTDNL